MEKKAVSLNMMNGVRLSRGLLRKLNLEDRTPFIPQRDGQTPPTAKYDQEDLMLRTIGSGDVASGSTASGAKVS